MSGVSFYESTGIGFQIATTTSFNGRLILFIFGVARTIHRIFDGTQIQVNQMTFQNLLQSDDMN